MKQHLSRFAALSGSVLALLVQVLIKNHRRHPEPSLPYFTYFLLIAAAVVLAVTVVSFFNRKVRTALEKSGILIGALFALLALFNILTGKTALLPVLLFPSFDNIFSVFVESKALMFRCIVHSFRLLGLGLLWGISIGFVTGLGIGYSRRVSFWLEPVIKVIGPVPATAWIPFALVVFPTTFGASVFVVALAVWFPVVLLTSSGIQNIPNAYFEVGKTLGAKPFNQLFRIAIPAALPNIFQGIFFGICSAFIALMTGEMFGAKAGIGWFINMEKELAEFKGVYAGLILIAIFCNVVLAILFRVRGRLLRWQKGLIKY